MLTTICRECLAKVLYREILSFFYVGVFYAKNSNVVGGIKYFFIGPYFEPNACRANGNTVDVAAMEIFRRWH
jgi:hypothetical protein